MTRLTEAEALKEIEALIERFRYARGMPSTSQENRAYTALKMAADEIRARQDGPVSETQAELERALADLERSNLGGSYSAGCLQNVALQARARWSTIRQALAFYEDARRTDAAE